MGHPHSTLRFPPISSASEGVVPAHSLPSIAQPQHTTGPPPTHSDGHPSAIDGPRFPIGAAARAAGHTPCAWQNAPTPPGAWPVTRTPPRLSSNAHQGSMFPAARPSHRGPGSLAHRSGDLGFRPRSGQRTARSRFACPGAARVGAPWAQERGAQGRPRASGACITYARVAGQRRAYPRANGTIVTAKKPFATFCARPCHSSGSSSGTSVRSTQPEENGSSPNGTSRDHLRPTQVAWRSPASGTPRPTPGR
jgi:hypothetical protein